MKPASTAVPAIPMLDLKAQYASIGQEIRAAIDAVLDGQQFILGENVRALESEIAQFCGRKYGIGVASGTDALILALAGSGIGEGDEVIVPSFTFVATAGAVSLLKAKPVFVDIDPATFTIDPARIAARITPRTKAIVPVHLYGQAADMDAVCALARERGLTVIEDNAQALGATYKGRRTGGIGDAGCISFFPSKNLGACGDAGMVVTDSEPLYRRLLSLRNHGGTKKYFSQEQGWNSRLDEMQAAILRVKLPHLEEWNRARRDNAARYDRLLAGIPGVITPRQANWGTHVFHQYTIRVRNRGRVSEALQAVGIANVVYYPHPTHLQPLYAGLGYRPGDLPETERACEEVLSLPIYPELTAEQMEYVAQQLAKAVQ